jgi:DNA-binding protein Fis
LKRTDNNKSKAAAMLNVTWQALDRRMKKFGLE